MDLFQTNLIVILMAMGFFNMKEEELLDQFSHEYCCSSSSSSSSSELCVPQDKLQDLKFLFVNNDLIISFNNDLISGFNNDSISGFNNDSISSLNNDSISSSEIPVTQEDDSSNVESRIVDEKSSKCDFYKEYYSSDEKETIRRCRHCKTQKTPQWRMGPLGRKTLCNACGVRYRAGRLLPEYRPAASPTFDGSKHSNFHKRIMRKKKKNYEEKEGYSNLHKRVLRRKKENYEEEEEEEGGFLQLVRPYIGYA